MVGVKAAPRGLVMVHAPPAAEESHLDLPLVDCRISDDFEELADCQLICGNEIIKCHSQILGMHSPVLSSCFSACKEKVLRLDECMEGVDTEAVKLLLAYMYSPDSMAFVTGLDMRQLEKAAVLADVWAMTRFLALCDTHLHGCAELKKSTPEGVVGWLLRANQCHLPRQASLTTKLCQISPLNISLLQRAWESLLSAAKCEACIAARFIELQFCEPIPLLQAKCEAYIAQRFNELKFCACMEGLGRDTWMRLMYISSYRDQGGKEAVLHRQAPATPGRPSWHSAGCVFSR
ncbi:g7041 [Coccomyxa viridis]|uniref:G7041 protein n=1 Tax=Coccomyxa viridis TaxID=1274662 RepID=A0ABP1FY20_9CHLO